MNGIKYFIYQTRLQNQSKFFGRVILNGVYNQAALIERMLTMGSSLTKPDIVAVLQLLSMAIAQVCTEGYKVNLDGLVQITPVLGGQFADKSDFFLAPRNTLYLTSQVTKALNERISQEASVAKVIVDENRPILLEVFDSEADEGSLLLTSGNITSINGKRLKFDTSQAGEYLRLVNLENPSEFVPVIKFHKLGDQELVFRLPEVTFTQGYFELANSLGTASVRIGRSASFLLAQG